MNLRLLKFIRLFHLIDKETYNKKRHILLITQSSYFDEKYYIKQNQGVDFKKISPAEHYLIKGWKEKKDPSPYFSTKGYLEENPDVKAIRMNPLLHYEISGKNEGRYRRKAQEKLFCSYGIFYHCLRKLGQFFYQKDILSHQKAKIFVHLHLFYINAWCEIKEYLKNLSCYPYDLVVTYPEDVVDTDFISLIKQFKSDAKVIPCANKGFDIGPFIAILKDIKLQNYDIIYHIHSKSIAGQKGRVAYNKLFKKKSWFKQLYSGCLGVFNVHKGINILLQKNHFGLIGAGNLVVKDDPKRIDAVKKYAARYGLMIPNDYEFLIGSCFGIRSHLLSTIKNLNLRLEDFHDSQRSIFTLAHALERLFATEVINAGYHFYKLPVLHNNHPLAIFIKNQKEKLYAKKIIHKLCQYGLSDLEMLNLDIKSGLNCVFLKGKYQNKSVFIKYGGIEEIAQNEAKMQQKMHQLMPSHTPILYLCNLDPVFVVMEMINGTNLEELINLGITEEEKKNILSELDDIKTNIEKHNFVHRDIQPANLIYKNDKLYLIDYQFMVERNANGSLKELNYVTNNPRVSSALGGAYRFSETDWNDTYSINLVKEKIVSVAISGQEKKVA